MTLRSLGHLAAYLPHLVGFEPHGSVVVVGLIDGAIGMTARVDVPGDAAQARDTARHVVSAVVRGGHTEALVFAVADGLDPTALVGEIEARADAFGLDISHTAWLNGHGSWRATRCRCGRCPDRWTALPDIRDHPAVLNDLADGRVPAPDRAALTRRLDPMPRIADAVAGAVGAARREMDAHDVVQALDEILYGSGPVSCLRPPTLATAAVGMQDVLVRDAVVHALLPQVFSGGGDSDVARLWHDLHLDREVAALIDPGQPPLDRPQARLIERARAWSRCLPDDLRPPVLTLFAALQWVDGGGALGATAVEQALRIDPGYRLAGLLWQAYVSGMRPILREHPRTA